MIHWFAEFAAQPFPLQARLVFSILLLAGWYFSPDRLRDIVVPRLSRPWRRRVCGRVSGPLLVGGCAFIGAALIGLLHAHQPSVPDEFSYLLASDTFAHGRLTNATHPLWRFFESYHVLQHPTYMSKYPPAQGFLLALGQALAGNPGAGVWLSSGLACAALCWALRAWVGPFWAFAGGLLMVAQIGIAGYWAQSFWGGMAAAIGGALVFGAVPRLRRNWRPGDAAWLTAGGMILANARPYEGLLAFSAAAVFLGVAAWRGPVPAWRTAVRLLPAVLAVAVPCAAAMGYYNWRVSGKATVLPYQAYRNAYNNVPDLIVFPLQPPPVYSSPLTAQYFQQMEVFALGRYVKMHSLRGFAYNTGVKFRTFWSFFYGPLLTLPFLLAAWTDERAWLGYLQSALVISFIFSAAFPFTHLSVAALFVGGIVQVALMFQVLDSTGARFALCGLSLVVAGILLEMWSAERHYAAPVASLFFLLAVEALRKLYKTPRRDRAPAGSWMPLWGAAVGAALILQGTAVVMGTPTPPATYHPDYIDLSGMSEKRAAIERQLRTEPGKHLVIVRYLPGHLFDLEWVYNEADIDGAQVVWAHDLGPDENRALLDYFSYRKVWVVKPDLLLSSAGAATAPEPGLAGTPGLPR